MSTVTAQEVSTLFDTLLEDISRASELLEKPKTTQKDVAKRFIKMSRRFFDVYSLFKKSFSKQMNVVAAKALIHFARSCYLVSYKLTSTDWVKLRKTRKVLDSISSIPRRTARKIYKRTLQNGRYTFQHDEDEYEELGFVKLEDSLPNRNYLQELLAVAANLREMGSQLVQLFCSCPMVDSQAFDEQWKLMGVAPEDEFSFDEVEKDVELSKEVLIEYNRAVVNLREELFGGNKSISELLIQSLQPILKRFGMSERKNVAFLVSADPCIDFCLLSPIEDTIKQVSQLILLLDDEKS